MRLLNLRSYGAAGMLALVAVLVVGIACTSEETTVTPARATWTTGYFQAALYSRAIEDLGYEVEAPTDLGNPFFYQSVADGDVDFWANGWFPLHNTYRDTFEEDASIAGLVAASGALQGYLVDKASADEYGITSVEDFKRDEVKEAFDSNGDGLADMVACPPGWGCELVIEHHLDAYDLRDHVNSIKAGYEASMADAIARYNAGESIFFYTWTPNWTVNALVPGEDVVWIEVPFPDLPEDQADLEDATVIDGITGCVNDPCAMGWPGNDINVVANNQFLEDNPDIERLFDVMSVPLEDIFAQNALMAEGEDSAEDISRHVDEWIAENQATYDAWIQEAEDA